MDLELDVPEGAAVGVAGPLDAVVGARGGDRRRLGRPVGAFHAASEGLAGGVHEGGADRGPARRDEPEAAHPLRGGSRPIAAIWEKKTGGAPMNDTRSSSMRRTPSSGSHAAMSTVGIPAVAGMSTPLSRPDTCANGAGMSTASPGPSPCTRHHERGLVAQAAVGVQRRLGHPGRPRGEQRHGDVGGPGRGREPAPWPAPARGRPSRLSGPAPPGTSAPGRCGRGHVGGGDDQYRVHLVEGGRHLGAAQAVVQRGGDGPEPPARPVEEEGGGAVGQLPAHDVPAPHPGRGQAPGQRADAGLDGGAGSRRPAVDHRRRRRPDAGDARDPRRRRSPAAPPKVASRAPRSQAPPGWR